MVEKIVPKRIRDQVEFVVAEEFSQCQASHERGGRLPWSKQRDVSLRDRRRVRVESRKRLIKRIKEERFGNVWMMLLGIIINWAINRWLNRSLDL